MDGKELTLVVLAAGLGSRFGGAKQVEAVGPNGETIIDYSIYDALRAGFRRVVFIVREELEATVRNRFTPLLQDRCAATYVVQHLTDLPADFTVPGGRSKPWGTGQAILCCRTVLDGPFAVINADDFYGADAFTVLAGFLSGGTPRAADEEQALVGYPIVKTLTSHGAVARGLCRVDGSGNLESIVERTRVSLHRGSPAFSEDGVTWVSIAPETLASMNLWGFTPSILPPLGDEFERFLESEGGSDGEFRISTAVGNLLERGALRVRVLRTSSQWLGVTYRDDLPAVREGIARHAAAGDYPSPLWKPASPPPARTPQPRRVSR